MSDLPAIQVKNLSKCYTISHKEKAAYNTIKDDFSNLLKNSFKKKESTEEKFWALKNISFEVKKGEIFGVIGKNGSGKSTLLKILSRIVDPTDGEVVLNGRVASLLEVGMGFHPDLTGRENVYFNGSMLGMSKKEISKKFNDIVEFAEIEKFIDTPVKFYSSGMYVRLAFSVAAHLDPDILILDEVLSVGDASFQKKSLQKTTETMEKGCTVLFVSHSMTSIQQLCSRGLMLNDGKIEKLGSSDEIADCYNDTMKKNEQPQTIQDTWANDGSIANDYFIPKTIYIEDSNCKKISAPAKNNEDKWFVVEGEVIKETDILNIGYMIKTEHKSFLYLTYDGDYKVGSLTKVKPGKIKISGKIPCHLLNEGKYTLSLIGSIYYKFWLFDPEENNPSVELEIRGGLSESPFFREARSGLLAPLPEWRIDNG